MDRNTPRLPAAAETPNLPPLPATAYALAPMGYLLDNRAANGLEAEALLLWLLVDQSCGKGGKCWKSNETLGRYLGVSGRSVARYLEQLEVAGMIVREKRPGRSSLLQTVNPARKSEPAPVCRDPEHAGLSTTPDTGVIPAPKLSTTPDTGVIREIETITSRDFFQQQQVSNARARDPWMGETLREINALNGLDIDPSNAVTKCLNEMKSAFEWADPSLIEPQVIAYAVAARLREKRARLANPSGYVIKKVLPYLGEGDLRDAQGQMIRALAYKAELVEAGVLR